MRLPDGSFYGATSDGGANGQGGIVFSLSADGKETVLHSFGSAGDGYFPVGPLAMDSAGNLYGVTASGGSQGLGVVFKITSAGQESLLHDFQNGNDSAQPYGGVTIDAKGDIYGTTRGSGADRGSIFKVTAKGRFSTLYRFSGGDDGGEPMFCRLLLDRKGDLYGTTFGGGTHADGTVFQYSHSGGLKVLHSFENGVDGSQPESSLTMDAEGTLYGSAMNGGAYGYGAIFEIDRKGHFSVLHAFAGTEGAFPTGDLFLENDGSLYGAISDYDILYRLTPDGQFRNLHHFRGGAMGGAYPSSDLIGDGQGHLFGTTGAAGKQDAGTVYSFDE